jgi:hypothetical protein
LPVNNAAFAFRLAESGRGPELLRGPAGAAEDKESPKKQIESRRADFFIYDSLDVRETKPS